MSRQVYRVPNRFRFLSQNSFSHILLQFFAKFGIVFDLFKKCIFAKFRIFSQKFLFSENPLRELVQQSMISKNNPINPISYTGAVLTTLYSVYTCCVNFRYITSGSHMILIGFEVINDSCWILVSTQNTTKSFFFVLIKMYTI